MGLAATLLPEFDHEMANTRKCIERVPEDKLDWKPHDKSMSLREITTHLANLLSWTMLMIEQDTFDIAPPGEDPPRVDPADSLKSALAMFDKNVAAARAAMEGASDELLLAPWTLLMGGNEVFKMPRVAVFRTMIMNHMIHHRAQLGVYLRLNDVAVPAMYGPTADESGM